MAINQHKDGKGVNDYKKGNRTNSKRNTTALRAINKERKEITDNCKRLMVAHRAKSKIQVEKIPYYIQCFTEYIEKQEKLNKPLTIAGFCLAVDLSYDYFNRIVNGDYDYIIEEYKTLHNLPSNIEEIELTDENGNITVIPLIPFSDLFKKCYLLIQQQLEENIYTNKGNPAGSIFGLKARFNWKEDEPKTVNQSMIIADAEKAREIIKMLE